MSAFRLPIRARTRLVSAPAMRDATAAKAGAVKIGRSTSGRPIPSSAAIAIEDLGVGHHIGSDDIDRAPAGGLDQRRAHQALDDVPLGDGLGAPTPPGRKGKDRDPLDQTHHEPERRAAGADDDRRPEAGRRRNALHQDPLDLEPRAHVRRQRAARLDPAEVDDPVDPGATAGRDEILGGQPVSRLEAARSGLHRMHEVVGDVAALERHVQPLVLEHIAPDGLHEFSGREPPAAGGRARAPRGPGRGGSWSGGCRRSPSRRRSGPRGVRAGVEVHHGARIVAAVTAGGLRQRGRRRRQEAPPHWGVS